MVDSLKKESKDSNRDQTRILELAYAHYMSVKADERRKINPIL